MSKPFSDPILEKIRQQLDVPHFISTNDVFHDMLSCIIEQQIHYRSSKRIFAKALERSGLERVTIETFDLFEKLGISQLKLSMSKYETLMAFTNFWRNNTLDFSTLTDEEVKAALSGIKGIGTWTIDMILLYTLQRPNVFPVDDFHLKQVMISLYKLHPTQKLKTNMLAIAAQWENQKSLATLYLLDWKKQQKVN
ncbi:DNA-3-methyladenine glycosylase family protein [Polaribacter sp.]|uniref:DNA-3-methyladenine glycosylase family protein n=1 Tax=Polaribacter sp. TaxID=1920175 RepID=UPI00404883A1